MFSLSHRPGPGRCSSGSLLECSLFQSPHLDLTLQQSVLPARHPEFWLSQFLECSLVQSPQLDPKSQIPDRFLAGAASRVGKTLPLQQSLLPARHAVFWPSQSLKLDLQSQIPDRKVSLFLGPSMLRRIISAAYL